MGRVKRYKKLKSIDPFAKRKKEENTIYDEEPEVYKKRVRENDKKFKLTLSDDAHRELQLQKEAMRRLRLDERQKNSQRYNTDIEAKGDNESMKAFKARVREKTKNSLLEVVPKMLPTNIRRKEKLKARSKLKKEKKLMKTHGGAFKKDDEAAEFTCAADGKLRPSDMGAPSSFQEAERLMFGEQPLRPPDLKGYGLVLAKKTPKRNNDEGLISTQSQVNENESDSDSSDEHGKMKRKSNNRVEDLFHDDGLEISRKQDSVDSYTDIKTVLDKWKRKKNSSSNNSDAQLELLREEAKQAYKKIQTKRYKEKN